jgi:hypothetical protein
MLYRKEHIVSIKKFFRFYTKKYRNCVYNRQLSIIVSLNYFIILSSTLKLFSLSLSLDVIEFFPSEFNGSATSTEMYIENFFNQLFFFGIFMFIFFQSERERVMWWRNFLNLPSARRPMFCLFHSIITKRALFSVMSVSLDDKQKNYL